MRRTHVSCLVCVGVLSVSALQAETKAEEAVAPAHARIPVVPDSGEEVLRLLKVRDAQFDEFILEYSKASVRRIDPARRIAEESFRDFKYGGRAKGEVKQLVPVPEPYNETVQLSMTMTVRGADTTYDQVVEGDLETEEWRNAEFVRQQRWSNSDRWVRQLGHSACSSVFYVDHDSAGPGVINEQRMATEFAFGFGFGSRLMGIDEYVQGENRLTVSGPIQIWRNDESRAVLEFDDQYILRSARIESDVRGNVTRFEVKTEGTMQVEGAPPIARRGSFRREWMGIRNGDVLEGGGEVRRQFEVTCKRMVVGVSEKEYERQTRMGVTPGTSVIDETDGAYPIPFFTPEKGISYGMNVYLWLNGTVIAFVVMVLAFRNIPKS